MKAGPNRYPFPPDALQATKEDVDRAVAAAWAAFPDRKAVEPAARSAILLKIADRIDENAQLLAQVETMDNGKPIRETHKVILSNYTQQKNIMINLNQSPSGFYPA